MSSTKYSWLPVTKNVPSGEAKSRNGSAAAPSSSTVPSTRSPTIATRSGAASLMVSTIRSVCARPASGPRWISDTTAMRNPRNAGSSRRRRTGSCSRSGGPSAVAAPTPTRPTDAAPAATALARARNIRRFNAGGADGLSAGRATQGRRRPSPLSIPLDPAAQREPQRLQDEQRQEQVDDEAEPEVARPRVPPRCRHVGEARHDERRDEHQRERDEHEGEDPSRASRAGGVLDQPLPEVDVHQRQDRAEDHDEHSRPSGDAWTRGICGPSQLMGGAVRRRLCSGTGSV